ncbi:MAG: cupin domain-containing protein [Xanthobacteraceae bacterium]|jgi:mannose-6-phosphate isomerase-like protein (cupin superfamily)
MATKLRKAKRAAPAGRAARKTSRSTSKLSARRRVAAAKAKPKYKAKAAPRKQTFVASHLNPDAFEGGLRSYAKYRDLGMAAATNGLAQAHVIKMIPPCDPAVVSKRHYHDVEFQMIYVLKGWIKGEYDGAGEVTMYEGSCWLQPPKIKHTVLDYSDDCELLEIILPAEFETVELE